MSWFTPKLESGERVLLRLPLPGRMVRYALLVLVPVLPLILALIVMRSVGQADGGGLLRLLVPGTGLIVLFLLHSLIFGWRIMVTDRRLFHKAAGASDTPDEIRLENIVHVEQDIPAFRLIVHGMDQEIAVPLDDLDAERIMAMIQAAKEGTA